MSAREDRRPTSEESERCAANNHRTARADGQCLCGVFFVRAPRVDETAAIATSIESIFGTLFGRVPVVAQVELAKMRRGGGR